MREINLRRIPQQVLNVVVPREASVRQIALTAIFDLPVYFGLIITGQALASGRVEDAAADATLLVPISILSSVQSRRILEKLRKLRKKD